MQRLPVAGQSPLGISTNLSRSISFSLIDQNGTDIEFIADENDPIELIIPRDPNAISSLLDWQPVKAENRTSSFHAINLTRDAQLTVSVHLELRPSDRRQAYWLIYRFNDPPEPSLIDGWSLFCPHSKAFSSRPKICFSLSIRFN